MTQEKGSRYHHGDLRAALIDTAIELIAERGVRNFSLAEASRRLGVSVSAPYAHFSDRDELLAAVAVRAYELFYAELLSQLNQPQTPADRLAAIARAYVRFAGTHRPLFEMLFEAGLDKSRHPELEVAEKPIDDAFSSSVRALPDCGDAASEEVATAIEAAAHGHALLLFDGSFGEGDEAVELAAERAARATLALVESRRLLSRRGTDDAA
jgi:AcrR family transcriptional regulator